MHTDLFAQRSFWVQINLNIGPALMPDVITGAMFSAILAWPTSSEVVAFHNASEELAARAVRLTKDQNPAVMSELQAGWPQHNWAAIEARSRKAKPALGYFEKRLQQRMAAARIGIGMTYLQLFGLQAVLPPTMTASSIDQFCKLIRRDVSISDPENIEKLVWRKSLPVLHLAIATQLYMTGKYADRVGLGYNLEDIDFYRDVVELARQLEPMIHDHPGILITRDQQTQVRWFE